MANITVLEANGSDTTVVFHIAIPSANNNAALTIPTGRPTIAWSNLPE